MIKRLVKLTFRAEEIETFKSIFAESKNKIAAMKGCFHVELLQVNDAPHIFFTLSIWESEEALNAYRASALFEVTWAKTKVLFADKPMAWSVSLLDKND